jgi:hypothetical protein
MATVNGYTPQALTVNVHEIGGGQNLLLNKYFRRRVTNPTQYVTLGNTNENIRPIPVSKKSGPGVLLTHASGTLKSIEAPRLNPIIPIDEQLAMQPYIGKTFQGSTTNLNASTMERITNKQRTQRGSIDLTLEMWCADVLGDGLVTLTDIKGTAIHTVDFDYVGGTGEDANVHAALSGTDAWDSDEADILGFLEEMERQIRAYSSYTGPLDVLCGYTALANARKNKQVKEMLDNRRMEFGGLATMNAQNYCGTIGNFPLYKYQQSAMASRSDTRTDLWDPKTICMLPSSGDGLSIQFAAVWGAASEGADLGFIQTEYFAHQYRQNNPAADFLSLESRPVPVIEDPRVIRVCQVVA